MSELRQALEGLTGSRPAFRGAPPGKDVSVLNGITGKIIAAAIAYDRGDPRRIHHFLKVYAFARAIGEQEGLDSAALEVLELAAVLHDIGIKASEEKYHSAAGKYQELEGPPVAREILAEFHLPPEVVERVCYLISRHHTYSEVDGLDYQALIEADFLVNIYEDGMSPSQVRAIGDRIFKTRSGKQFLKYLYLD